MIAVLLLALQSLMAGASIATVLAGIPLATWIEIAVALLRAEPVILDGFQKIHPIFEQMIKSLKNNVHPHVVGATAHYEAVYIRDVQPIGGGGGL